MMTKCPDQPSPLARPPAISLPAPVPANAPGGPLSGEQLEILQQAAKRRQGATRVARVARGSAITTLTIAGMSLLVVMLSPSMWGLVITLGLSAVGVVELIGSRRASRLDPLAPRLLGRNQLAFLALIVIYCIAQMIDAESAISPDFRDALRQGMPEMEKMVGPLVRGFYGLVILLSVACQGGLSLYYFRRRKTIEDYIRQTPPWALGVLQKTNLP